jgi:hypothetical protein
VVVVGTAVEAVKAGVVEAVEAGLFLVDRGDDPPGRIGVVGAVKHLFFGFGVGTKGSSILLSDPI